MDSKLLTIGYAGILHGYDPLSSKNETFLKRIKKFFYDYRINNISNHTRSGYYLFQGIKLFKEKYPESAKSLKVELWGMIDILNSEQVREFQLTDVVSIKGYFPKSQSYEKLMKCDILFLPLEGAKGSQRPLFIPGKLYEYMKTGKPILALAEKSDCTDILNESGLGIICSPFHVEDIADTLFQLICQRGIIADLYKPNYSYISTNFDFKNISAKMASVFTEVLYRQKNN